MTEIMSQKALITIIINQSSIILCTVEKAKSSVGVPKARDNNNLQGFYSENKLQVKVINSIYLISIFMTHYFACRSHRSFDEKQWPQVILVSVQ